MAHFRIERADNTGSKRVTIYDRIYAVADDGTEVDVSNAIRGWNVNARAGLRAVEEATFYVAGVRLIENMDLVPVEQATAEPGELR